MKMKAKTTVFALLGNTLLLFLGLFAGVYSLDSAFGLGLSPMVFGVVCLTAIGVAALHSFCGGRLRVVLTLAACALVALAVWQWWDSVFLGAQFVFHKISYAFHQEIRQILYYELPVALSDEAYGLHASRFVCALIPLLGLWLGAWQLRGRAAWPAAVAMGVLPGLSLFILRSPGAAPLYATLLYLALSLLCRKGYRQSLWLGGRRALTAAAPVAAAMALIVLLFPQKGYQRPAWVEDLRLRAKTMAQSWALSGGNGGAQPGVYTFRRFGSPSFDGHTVLTVRAERSGHALLRGWSAARYTRYGWQPLSDQALAALPEADADSAPWSYPAHAALDSGAALASQTIQIIEGTTNTTYYYVPYFSTSMYTGATFHADSYIQRLESHYSYSFDCLDPDQVPAGAQVGWDGGGYYGEPEYRQFVYRNYLDMPYDLLGDEALEVIRAGARYAQGQAPGLDDPISILTQFSYADRRGQLIAQAQAVADYLASFTHYDLSTPAQPLGEDFVSHFLTESRQGYCAHYATAATLILREMGVPARFVSGYAADLVSGQSVSVPDENAHAWVEVYVDGFGWQPVDVTPAGAFGPGPEQTAPSPSPSAAPSAQPDPSQAPASPSPSPSPSPSAAPSVQPSDSPGPGQSQDGSTAGHTGAWWALGCGLALAAAMLAVWLQRWLRLGRWKKRCGQQDPNAAVLWLYRYLLAARSRFAYALPERAAELAQKAAFSQHTLTQAERREMEDLTRAAYHAAKAQPWGPRLRLRWVWCLI